MIGQDLILGEDGVYQPHPLGLVEQTNEQYHGGPGVSKSHLDAMAAGSPLHYWAQYINPEREPVEDTPATLFGSALHSAVLEPDLFPSQYIASPLVNMRTNAGKAEALAFRAANPGKSVLSQDDFDECLRVRDAVHRHPVASGLLVGGKAEQSFYAIDPETGVLIKCRTDYIHDSGALIVDLKSTKDASPVGFGRSAADMRYPVQPAWYNGVFDAAFGEHPTDWAFLCVEKTFPYAIGIYYVTADQVERGRIAARRDFLRIVECRESGIWPDYGFEPQPLLLPAWAKL